MPLIGRAVCCHAHRRLSSTTPDDVRHLVNVPSMLVVQEKNHIIFRLAENVGPAICHPLERFTAGDRPVRRAANRTEMLSHLSAVAIQ